MDRAPTAAELRQCVEADEGWQADPSALSVHEIANFHARAPECQNASSTGCDRPCFKEKESPPLMLLAPF